jgi:hypothetical protein
MYERIDLDYTCEKVGKEIEHHGEKVPYHSNVRRQILDSECKYVGGLQKRPIV